MWYSMWNRLKWWCFKRLYLRMCVYHRMKALLWTRARHHEYMSRHVDKIEDNDVKLLAEWFEGVI